MVRRGPHEGSIYQRADGRWVGSVHVGYEDGKRVRKTVYGRTRGEVAERMAVMLRDLQQGITPAPQRQTLAQFLEQYLDATLASLRPTTHKRYSDLLTLHVIPTLGRRPLARLTPADVERLLAAKQAAGLSAQTVAHVRAVLRTALNRAVRWGLVARNVAALTAPPRVVREPVVALTPERARAILDAAAGDPLGPLVITALGTGLRQGELLALTWTDVDLDARSVRVRRQLQRVNGQTFYQEPKSQTSRRTVPLPAFGVLALRAQRRAQATAQLAAGDAWHDEGLVFTSSIGTPLDARNVTRAFHALLDAHWLPPMRFHDLRHGAATLMLAQGTELRTIMETLGHSQIGVTAAFYAHVLPSLQRDAADGLDRLLGGPS